MNSIKDIDCFLLDMDGTIYLSNQLIDKAFDFIKLLEEQDKEYVFFTNNSSKNTNDYQKKLKKFGLDVPIEKIVNSGQVTANYVRKHKENAVVYPVGTPSLEKELADAGLAVVKEKREDIDFLVLGFDKTLNYKKLWDAHDLISDGVEYIATNPDYVCPLENGKSMPDCGSIISLLETSTGKRPLVVGKPNTLMIDYVSQKLDIKKDRMAMVGDRIYTDIQMAINAGITGILVLSGESTEKTVEESPQEVDYVFNSVADIMEQLKK